MTKVEFRDYDSAHTILGFIQVCAWIAIIGGSLWAITMFLQDSPGYGNPNNMAKFFAAIPGMAVAQAGLVNLLLMKIGQAIVDKAEMTQEMLAIARNGGQPLEYDKKRTVTLVSEVKKPDREGDSV